MLLAAHLYKTYDNDRRSCNNGHFVDDFGHRSTQSGWRNLLFYAVLCLVRSQFHVFRGQFLSTGTCHFRHASHLRLCCLEVLLCRLDAFHYCQRSLYGRNDWVGIFTSVVEELAHELSSARYEVSDTKT